jgi:hypothetical protein
MKFIAPHNGQLLARKQLSIIPLVSLALSSAGGAVRAQDVNQLRETLTKRSAALETSGTKWAVTQRQQAASLSEQRKQDIARQIAIQADRDASRQAAKLHKPVDPASFKKAIEQEQTGALNAASGAPWTMSSEYTLTRNNGDVLLTGTQLMSDHTTKLLFNQTYHDGWACFETVPLSPQGVSKPTTQIYATPGKAQLYRSPIIGALDVLPEEICLLSGSNLLERSDVDWRLQSTPAGSSRDRVVVGEVRTGEFSPYRLTIVLSAEHGMAPASIVAQSEWPGSPLGNWTAIMSVAKWSRANGIWSAEDASTAETAPNWSRERKWHRSGTADVPNSLLALKKGDAIADHRLQGDALRYKDVFNTKQEDVTKVVTYGWNGKVPDISELEKIRAENLERLGAAHPMKAWLFIPGLLTVTAGVALSRVRLRKSQSTAS